MNQQDQMFSKTVSKVTAKKEEWLREKIAELINEKVDWAEWAKDDTEGYEIADSILQQVIEWIELRKGKYGDQSKYDEAINDLISQLKGELS